MQLSGAEVRGHAGQLYGPGQRAVGVGQPVAPPPEEDHGLFGNRGPQLSRRRQAEQVGASRDPTQSADCFHRVNGQSLP